MKTAGEENFKIIRQWVEDDISDDLIQEAIDSTNSCYSNSNAELLSYVEGYANAKLDKLEFAKFHVTAALKQASENAKSLGVTASNSVTYWSKIDKDSVLNSYPLTNIQ